MLKALRDEIKPAIYARCTKTLRQLIRDSGGARDAHIRAQITLPLLRSARGSSEQFARECRSLLVSDATEAARQFHIQMQGRRRSLQLSRLDKDAESPTLFTPKQTLSDVLAISFSRSLRRINRQLGHKSQAPRKLHRLRLKMRNARYLSEMRATDFKVKQLAMLRGIRKMQNSLGDWHDSRQLIEWLCQGQRRLASNTPFIRKIRRTEERQYHLYRKYRKTANRELKQYLAQS
jgi:CHAD domain-containing protein